MNNDESTCPPYSGHGAIKDVAVPKELDADDLDVEQFISELPPKDQIALRRALAAA